MTNYFRSAYEPSLPRGTLPVRTACWQLIVLVSGCCGIWVGWRGKLQYRRGPRRTSLTIPASAPAVRRRDGNVEVRNNRQNIHGDLPIIDPV